MPQRAVETPLGTLCIECRSGHETAALELGETLAREGREVGEFVTFDGVEVFLKGGPMRGRARRRHGLRRLLLRRPVPRVNEYANLRWLRERHFQTPEPLAAGVVLRRGWPEHQFLVTARVDDTRTLLEELDDGPPDDRAALVDELAREVARMHALGFLHHDLFPRNVLVAPPDRPRRLLFLDAWAGGPPTQLRGPHYDLACLMLEGAELLTRDEQEAFFETYVDQRERQGRPADRRTLVAKTAKVRLALRRTLVRDPGRMRGRPLPGESWGL